MPGVVLERSGSKGVPVCGVLSLPVVDKGCPVSVGLSVGNALAAPVAATEGSVSAGLSSGCGALSKPGAGVECSGSVGVLVCGVLSVPVAVMEGSVSAGLSGCGEVLAVSAKSSLISPSTTDMIAGLRFKEYGSKLSLTCGLGGGMKSETVDVVRAVWKSAKMQRLVQKFGIGCKSKHF